MARRVGGAGEVLVPGLRAALAAHYRRLDDRWTGQRFGELADAAERGDPVLIDGETVWRALFAARSSRAVEFLHSAEEFELVDAADRLRVVGRHPT